MAIPIFSIFTFQPGKVTERLLQYIWEHNYYRLTGLLSTQDQPLRIVHPGTINKGQGPDFLNARIRYENSTWVGHIELHVNTSDWLAHGHTSDPNYRNVILHVVWQDDTDLGLDFPTLVLHDKVSSLLLSRYEMLMQEPSSLACGSILNDVPAHTWESWKIKLFHERLLEKSLVIRKALEQSRFDWEEVLWRMLAHNFGGRLNGETFEQVAISLSYRLIRKHSAVPGQLEALLFGQAGLLSSSQKDEYNNWLWQEYRFLKKKYDLSPVAYPLYYLRMRPANFPTIRLAQLAALVCNHPRPFSIFMESTNITSLKKVLHSVAGEYWNTHYLFGKTSKFQVKKTGSRQLSNLLVNTVLPFVYAYGIIQGKAELVEKATNWFLEIEAEQNRITGIFMPFGIANSTSADSQALIHLHKSYCSLKRCLHCDIGNFLLKESAQNHYGQL